jgi:ethanolamine ammonia-lyase small subunit
MTEHEPPPPPATDPWPLLRSFTTARIGLGRAGVSLPTGAQLAFQLAHAQARDAVHSTLDVEALRQTLAAQGHDPLTLHSAAPDRPTYLQRPDLGRQLDEPSAQLLAARVAEAPDGYDAAFVIADGLSALAVERHAAPLLAELWRALEQEGWRLAPLCVVEQGRVAISDEIGALLGARQVVILLGERPGLSAPDSLGAYLTYAPRVGNSDAQRNCVSNIREHGLSYAAAAHKLLYLMRSARQRQLSGVELKDEATQLDADGAVARTRLARNFLVDDG